MSVVRFRFGWLTRPWVHVAGCVVGLVAVGTAGVVSAEELHFTLDPAQSLLSVVADYDGFDLIPQVFENSDGDLASYSGELIVELDDIMAPTSIRFNGGLALAANTGMWLPSLEGGDVGEPDVEGDANPGEPALGNYGLYLDLSLIGGGEAWGTFRDMGFTVLTETDVDVATDGTFASEQGFQLAQGTWTTTVSSELLTDGGGVDDITGDASFNEASPGKYSIEGNIAKLELPVSLYFPAAPNFLFEGQFVATAVLSSGLAGDFNNDGVLDAADINLLTAEVNAGTNRADFDLNQDNLVSADDRLIWINELRKTYVGDSNLDGVFDTTDFVGVFQAGQYEDGVAGNSTWETGDWNGDTEFDSGDFVAAFQGGGFEQGPRAAVAAVPEPAAALLLLIGAGLLAVRRR